MIVMFPIVSIPMFQVEAITARLDALWLSHTKNHDFSNMLVMANTGESINLVTHTQLSRTITQSRDNLVLRIGMCSIDMVTGVMHGITISFITGTNRG